MSDWRSVMKKAIIFFLFFVSQINSSMLIVEQTESTGVFTQEESINLHTWIYMTTPKLTTKAQKPF
jgi:hypothetical protein